MFQKNPVFSMNYKGKSFAVGYVLINNIKKKDKIR